MHFYRLYFFSLSSEAGPVASLKPASEKPAPSSFSQCLLICSLINTYVIRCAYNI